MANSNSGASPLDAAAGAAGQQAVSAFHLLSDGTRLAILLALWEAFDPYSPTEALSFSDLYDRVAIDDTANFTYHLDKLTGHFVEKMSDGYHLRKVGLIVVRAVIAGTGLDESEISASDLEIPCHRCGEAQIQISYRDGAIYLTCSNCEGFTASDDFPHGTIAVFPFDPAGLANRSPQELLAASAIRGRNNHRMMMEGVCPSCSGPIDASLQLCEEHYPGDAELCPNCGKRDCARVRYVCTICKNHNSRPVELTVVEHSAVITFFADHDVDMRWNMDDIEGVVEGLERLWAMEHSLRSTDPVRIRVAAHCGGHELYLTLDENWDVIDVSGAN